MRTLANGRKVKESHIANEFPCGCFIISEFTGGIGCQLIEYCPKHTAAPDLYEACKDMAELLEHISDVLQGGGEINKQSIPLGHHQRYWNVCKKVAEAGNQALAKAEGK